MWLLKTHFKTRRSWMSHSNAGRRKRQMDLLRTQFAQREGLAFAEVLPAERVERALEQEVVSWRDCVFTPLLTVWAFLSQVISADGARVEMVGSVLASWWSGGVGAC